MIEVKEGRRYLTRDNRVVGPMGRNVDGPILYQQRFPWTDGSESWTSEGRWQMVTDDETPDDLVGEIPDTPRPGDAPGSRDRGKSPTETLADLHAQEQVEAAAASFAFATTQEPPQFGEPAPREPAVFAKTILKTTKASLLDAAKAAVADRGLNYGKPEDNFNRIATLWNGHLKNRFGDVMPTPLLTANDVAQMMALMKIARLENDPSHLDSWTDLAGYAACGAEISA